MKRLMFFLLAFFTTQLPLHAQTLHIYLTDGNIITLNLADIDSITFTVDEQNTSPGDTLVAYYPLDGNAIDASGNGYDGILVNAVPDTDRFGNPTGCLYFDGNSYIDLGNVFDDIYLPVTVAMWIKFYDDNGNVLFNTDAYINRPPDVPEAYYGFWMRLKNQHLAFSWGNGGEPGYQSRRTIISNDTIPKGYWIHVAGVSKGYNEFELYINGIKVDGQLSGIATEIAHDPQRHGRIGKGFIGKIDEVYFYNKALSGKEILEIMNKGFYTPAPQGTH